MPAAGALPIIQEWQGNVSNAAPQTGVADDGETVTTLPEDARGHGREVASPVRS